MNDMIPQGRHQQGAAMVEFTLVVFVFLILVFGIIEFAFAIFQWSRVVDATREGARAAIVNNMACGKRSDLVALCGVSDENTCVGMGGDYKWVDGVCGLTCTGDVLDDSPILAAMNRRNLGISGDLVTVTYSCSSAGSAQRDTPIPEVTVRASWKHRFLFSGITTDPSKHLVVDLPSFATTRLGEDLDTP